VPNYSNIKSTYESDEDVFLIKVVTLQYTNLYTNSGCSCMLIFNIIFIIFILNLTVITPYLKLNVMYFAFLCPGYGSKRWHYYCVAFQGNWCFLLRWSMKAGAGFF
jgi:hypothetical protein